MKKEHAFYPAVVAIADCIQALWNSGIDPNDDDMTTALEELVMARASVNAAAQLFDLARKTNPVELEAVGYLKDGGSVEYRANDGMRYWQCFKIGMEEYKGILFEGLPWDLTCQAVGDFILTREDGAQVLISQKSNE